MEELRSKLEYSRPSVVGSALSRLTDIIISKLCHAREINNTLTPISTKENEKDEKLQNASEKSLTSKLDVQQTAAEELEILWSTCRSNNPSTAIAAVDFLIHLNILGYLDHSSTLTNLMATSSQFKSTEALVNAIGRLLTIDFLEENLTKDTTKLLSEEHAPNSNFGIELCGRSRRFSIESNQHPFISLLRASPSTNWPHIANSVRYFIESQKYNQIEINDFIRPVFLFVLCNPYENPNLAGLRSEFRSLLLKHFSSMTETINLVLEWTKYTDKQTVFLEYAQFLLDIFEARKKFLAKTDIYKDKVVLCCAKQLPFLLALSCNGIKLGLNINHLLNEIKSRIDFIVEFSKTEVKASENDENRSKATYNLVESLNISIIELSNLIQLSPHVYHDTICSCVLSLINLELSQRKVNIIGQLQLGMFVSSILPMMSFSSPVTSKVILKGGGPQILLHYRKMPTDKDESNFMLDEIETELKLDGEWDSDVRWSKCTNRLLRSFQNRNNGGDDIVIAWLKQINNFESIKSLQKLFSVFCTILLSVDSINMDVTSSDLRKEAVKKNLIVSLVMQQMQRCVKLQPTVFASPCLTLVLYKLSFLSKNWHSLHSASNPNNTLLQLLNILPQLALDRGCISSVVQIIQSLGAKPKLVALELNLFLALWKIESRCYPFLQKALEKNYTDDTLSIISGEIALAKANVIKDICQEQAHQYGADLLRLLSDILNQCCSEPSKELDNLTQLTFVSAANTALEGIIILCKEGVIDIATTVKVLSPKLKRDHRPEICAKFTELLSIAPLFKLDTDEYRTFIRETLTYLWKIACQTHNEQPSSGAFSRAEHKHDQTGSNHILRIAAIRAIAKFNVEYHHLKMMPNYAKVNLKLPPSYCTTPMEAARKPEDVLSYVPGEAWTELLIRCDKDQLTDFESVVSTVAKQEVENLPRSVYSVASKWAQKHHREEPTNYHYLPEKSVLRAIISNLLGLQMNLKPLPTDSSGYSTDMEGSNKVHTNHVHESFLRILAYNESRPLPPLDWSTFRNSIRINTQPKLIFLIFPILINQASTSNSARSLIESILSSGSAIREVVLDVFNNLLKVLVIFLHSLNTSCVNNSTGEIFVTDAIQMWTTSAIRDSSATQTYLNILKGCKEALKTNEIHNFSINHENIDTYLDSAKDIICSALESINDQLIDASMNPSTCSSDVDIEIIYEAYLDAVAEMPSSKLEKMSR